MINTILQNVPFSFLTQSVWRDEAYSILIAQKPLSTYLHLSFEPPLYYILLHFWVKLFGTSEIAVRSLSLLAFSIAIICIIRWSKKMFTTTWFTWYVPLLFLFNPMLLYYAFEARAYAWFVMFTVISCYSYFEKKWPLHIFATTLGLYTHVYLLFVPFAQLLHYIFVQKEIKKFSLKAIYSNPFMKSLGVTFVLFMPWIIKIAYDIPRLNKSWYFPVDTQLFKSILGNMFLGYEGTPWNLWTYTQEISLIILIMSVASYILTKEKNKLSFFLILLYVPLLMILSISIIKPLFVLRYMIPCTIAEIFIFAYLLDAIKPAILKKFLAALLLMYTLWLSQWFGQYHQKPAIRDTVAQINALQRKNDIILVDDALLLYEAMYYNRSSSKIYWYNPREDPFPWYIGDFIVNPSQIIGELPSYPYRAFLLKLDGTFEITYNTVISKKTK